MTAPFIYQREGPAGQLGIWDGEVTRNRRGEDIVFWFRPQQDGELKLLRMYAGKDVNAVMETHGMDGTLQPRDVFVVQDSLVYTQCDTTLSKRREHDAENCEAAITAAAMHRSVLDLGLAPREYDWAEAEFTPAVAKAELETGEQVELGRDFNGVIVATAAADQGQTQHTESHVVVQRDIQDGQLAASGQVIQTVQNFEKAQALAVQMTNEHRWEAWQNREQKQEPEISRSR